MRADDLASFLPILLDKHHVTPRGCAEVTGVVVGIARPNKAVIGHMVPFFARDFAGFATNAHSRIGEEANLDVVTHVSMPALIRAFCAFADHGSRIVTDRRAVRNACFRIPSRPAAASYHSDLILFLRLRGPRRFVLFGKTALLDARSLAQFAVHIC